MPDKKTGYQVWQSRSSLEILRVENIQQGFPLHTHDRICLGRIDQGAKILVINEQIIELEQGDWFLIPAHAPHMCQVKEEQLVGYTIFCADNTDELLAGVLLVNEWEAVGESVFFDIKRIEPCTNRFKGYDINNDKIDFIIKFIETNYREPLTVTMLAQISQLSPYHLLHIFKAEVGLSLHQFLLQTRVKRFKEQAPFQQDLLDLALSCGFYDQSHLIRNFKKYMGITPRQYLNSIRTIGSDGC
ncbi:MAG TPA: AraC family transcriptional regulator [Bacillota bacterium]|nr:AraC family transcriptional regulator [Bacillota bacterium]